MTNLFSSKQKDFTLRIRFSLFFTQILTMNCLGPKSWLGLSELCGFGGKKLSELFEFSSYNIRMNENTLLRINFS